MKTLWISLLVLASWAGTATAETFDRPVTSLDVTSEGALQAGFMYWYAPYGLFLQPSEFILLGVVTEVTTLPDGTGTRRRPRTAGRLSVNEIVLCPANLREEASRVRWLESDGFDRLEVGDSVIVFMARYEGAYAIPARLGTNCLLGYRFSREENRIPFDRRAFVALLSEGQAWSLDRLTPLQLRLWARVDSEGVAEALIQEREAKQEGSDGARP